MTTRPQPEEAVRVSGHRAEAAPRRIGGANVQTWTRFGCSTYHVPSAAPMSGRDVIQPHSGQMLEARHGQQRIPPEISPHRHRARRPEGDQTATDLLIANRADTALPIRTDRPVGDGEPGARA